jgi:hypothetical protein
MMGLVSKAQTYCGLEIDIMQMTPKASWTHFDFKGFVLSLIAYLLMTKTNLNSIASFLWIRYGFLLVIAPAWCIMLLFES